MVLKNFQALKHVGKLLAWKHYLAMTCLSDNIGVDDPKVCVMSIVW